MSSSPTTMTADMAKKPHVSDRRLIAWAIAAVLSSGGASVGVNHFIPSTAAQHASDASDAAVQKAADAAAKSALVESTVATHTSELNNIGASVDTLRMDVAVLKAQGESEKNTLESQSEKM